MELGDAWVYNAHYGEYRLYQGWNEAAPNVKLIIRYFLDCKKVVGSLSLARKLILEDARFTRNGKQVVFTEEDLQDAYAMACGGGCEYEWPYE